MRPTIQLPKGEKLEIPDVLKSNQVPHQTQRVQPKGVDHFMDKPLEIKGSKGAVIFEGTPRQWQRWAHQRELEEREAAGLGPTVRGSAPSKRLRR